MNISMTLLWILWSHCKYYEVNMIIVPVIFLMRPCCSYLHIHNYYNFYHCCIIWAMNKNFILSICLVFSTIIISTLKQKIHLHKQVNIIGVNNKSVILPEEQLPKKHLKQSCVENAIYVKKVLIWIICKTLKIAVIGIYMQSI